MDGIFWVLRTGAPWEDMPERYGPRTTVYNRFVRWRKAGVWERLFQHLQGDLEASLYMIDSLCFGAELGPPPNKVLSY